jgi:hypothetical protein
VNRFTALLLTVLAMSGIGQAGAAEVAGVKIDDKLKFSAAGPELVLNGAGLRTRYRLKVYVAGLYLAEKKASAADVVALKGPKRIQIWIMRDVAANQMSSAFIEALNANLSATELEKFKSQIQQFNATFSAIEAMNEGDVMTIDLLPGTGTRISVNAKASGTPIAGDDFYAALLKIWLGDNPVQADLKKALLGQI